MLNSGSPPVAASRAAPTTDLEVAVIGAGPHALSAAVHLRRRGVHARVFGEPMSFWRTMPEGMLLRSNLSATNLIEPAGPLSLSRYAQETGTPMPQPVPLSRFIEYGLWVAGNALPEIDHRRVDRLDAAPAGFTLMLADGEALNARRVVIAGGIAPFVRVPRGFDHLAADRVSHTAELRVPAAFSGRSVAVVGGGQSALECAALMAENGAREVEVLATAPAVVWLRGHSVKKALGRLGPILYAPTDVGPLWYSRLVAAPNVFRRLPRATQDRIAQRSIRPACSHFVRVRLGQVKVTTGVRVVAAKASAGGLELTLSDGTPRCTDHLMFGTGYEVDFARYPFLGAGIRRSVRLVDGYPVLTRGLESSLPGLHVLGAPAARSFGPIMRFVSGSWYAGSAVARRLGERDRIVRR
jgi:lysine/ornithine N-monooxygenase